MTHALRIMGLDLSLNGTGVCLPDSRVLTIKLKAEHGDNRLCIIRDTVRRFLPQVDLCVIEGMGRFKGNTGLVIAQVHGTIKTELMDAGVPYAIVTPSTLKKWATGNGSADKELMAAAALDQAGLRFRDDNQADAWWLREAGLDHYGMPMNIPQPTQERSTLLTVADWPMITNRAPVRA